MKSIVMIEFKNSGDHRQSSGGEDMYVMIYEAKDRNEFKSTEKNYLNHHNL